MKSEFEIAITQLSSDRNLSPDVILEAIEMALVSAYKRNFGASQNVSVTLDPHTGKAQVYVKKQVVEQVEDDRNEMTLDEARAADSDAELGNFIDVEVKPRNFGRIAAQTAKQVITQRIREAERDSVYAEYAEREAELVNGTVRNVDSRSRNVVVSLGQAEAILPRSEQIPREHYRFGQRVRVYIVSVERAARGPQITVSRTHPDLLKRLLELEVPEIHSGTVEVKAIAREPGFRSKVAVAALQAGVDPVGSCVGMRGVRIQNIVNELSGEKIDVVEWSRDEKVYIANALSPAKVEEVYLNTVQKSAKVVVPDRALSLAIGKEGQNARLAAKLTGWRIDIKSESEAAEEADELAAEMEAAAEREQEKEAARRAAAELLAVAEALLDEDEEAIAAEESESDETEEVSEAILEETQESLPEPEVADEMVGSAEDEQEVSEEISVQEEESSEDELESESVLEETDEPDADHVPAESESEEDQEFDLEPEPEDIFDDEESRDRGKKRRDRRLEYDEKLGRVVSRKRHKRQGLEDWDENWD